MKKSFIKTTSLIAASALAIACIPISNGINVSAATLLSAEFETTNDSFKGRGAAKVQWNSDCPYNENCSLFVSDRTAVWNGAMIDTSSIIKSGNTYSLSAAVYQSSGEPVEMKLSLQYKNAEGTVEYSQIDLQTAESGEWLVLSNDSYTVPQGASEMSIYVETTESLTDFYLDSVTIKGSPLIIKKGDANGDLTVDVEDAKYLQNYLLGKTNEIELGADFNNDKVIDSLDLVMLREYVTTSHTPTISGDWDNYVESVSPQQLQMFKDSLYRVGNTERIRKKIAKAQNGEQVNIAYIGGSITAGGSSSSPNNCFANLSFQYFKDTFGTGNNVNYINSGMAGTSSVVGNMRVDNDVLAKNADIIFIEFAVNDQDGERFKKSYESLVRKCLENENAPVVIPITLCTKSEGSCQDWMAKIAENYDLPLISGKNAVTNAIKRGDISWDKDYGSGDTIHPGNNGHKIIADCIGYYYRQALRSENATDEYIIPNKSVFGSEYSTAKLMTVEEMQNLSKGSWSSGTNNSQYSKNGFTFSKNGNTPISFTTEGKGIILLFQSNDNDSYGTVKVDVNGNVSKISSKLPWTWGGLDGDIAYYQSNSGNLNVSISMDNPSKSFVLYGIAVIK